MKTIKESKYGNYEHYKGDIWISEYTNKPSQGMNIAEVSRGELRVLAYVVRKGDEIEYNTGKRVSLAQGIWNTLKSYGWTDEACNRRLGNTNH